jgi:hypothetical protein
VTIGELARRHTHKRQRTTRPEVNADNRRARVILRHDVAPIGSCGHRAGIMATDRAVRIVNPHNVVMQVEDQIEGAARYKPCRRTDRNILQRPEICDEPCKRRAGIPHDESHDSRMPHRSNQRNAVFRRCLNTSSKRR